MQVEMWLHQRSISWSYRTRHVSTYTLLLTRIRLIFSITIDYDAFVRRLCSRWMTSNPFKKKIARKWKLSAQSTYVFASHSTCKTSSLHANPCKIHEARVNIHLRFLLTSKWNRYVRTALLAALNRTNFRFLSKLTWHYIHIVSPNSGKWHFVITATKRPAGNEKKNKNQVNYALTYGRSENTGWQILAVLLHHLLGYALGEGVSVGELAEQNRRNGIEFFIVQALDQFDGIVPWVCEVNSSLVNTVMSFGLDKDIYIYMCAVLGK